MDKKLLIGGAVVVVGGAIATAVVLSTFDASTSGKPLEESLGQEVEKLQFEDFADEDRYSFCQGREEIKGPYSSSVFGNEKGDIEYVSEDISVFDKEKNKLLILGRTIRYTYSGIAETQSSAGDGSMQIEEQGMTVEYYPIFSAPVRIDYNTNVLFPAPERKRTDWVVIERKGRGTVMGFTQESVDTEMGDAKTFCPPFAFKNAFITPEYVSFKDTCAEGSGGGFSFSGNYTFECGGTDNQRGVEMVEEYKSLAEARELLESSSEGGEGEKNEFQEIIGESTYDDGDIQGKLQQMREDMKDDGAQSSNSAE